MTVAAKRRLHDPYRHGAGCQSATRRYCHDLAHPGGNVTGTLLYGSELAGKRVDVFKQAVPGISRIAVLGAGASPVTRVLWPETQNAVQSLRLEARLFTVHDPCRTICDLRRTIAQG